MWFHTESSHNRPPSYGAGVRVVAALGEVERDAGTAEILVILCLDGDVCALYVCMTS